MSGGGTPGCCIGVGCCTGVAGFWEELGFSEHFLCNTHKQTRMVKQRSYKV